jgi:glutamate/tyrosine decarboxylase-like PLP-dependent enzyme
MIDIPPDEFRRLGYRAVDLLAECGCALVRDSRAMRDAFSLVPPYLRDEAALPWFSEFGIQQSRGLLELVQSDGEVFLTGTELAGRFVLRACIVNFRTTEQDLEALIETVRMAGERVREQETASGPV